MMKVKKILYIFLACLLTVQVTYAQTIADKVSISGIRVAEKDGIVDVSFDLDVHRKAAKAKHTLIFAPVLSDGTYKVSMPLVVVEGRGVKVNRDRHELASGKSVNFDNAVYANNGSRIRYSARVDAQPWMHGADILLESVDSGCCDYEFQDGVVIAHNLDLESLVQPVPVVEVPSVPVIVEQPLTVAESIASTFTFVRPAEEFNPWDVFKLDDDEREKALAVYFHVGKSSIDPYYMDNKQTLINLIASINMINNSQDSNVSRIVIAGFASPEGSARLNEKLSRERALSIRDHVVRHTGIPESGITIHGGGVDWTGLRYLVEKSNMREKYQVIDIIDNFPVWDAQNNEGRLGTLMKLNGGVTYRFMLRELFPYLRNGAFIKVYYDNK